MSGAKPVLALWVSQLRAAWARLAEWADRRPRAAWVGVLLAVFIVTGVEAAYFPLNDYPGATWHHADRGIDVELMQEWASRAGPADLWRFWVGTYYGGPTYRPLAGMWITAEWHLFGREDRRWCAVSVAFHMVVVLLVVWAGSLWFGTNLRDRLAFGAASAVFFAGPWFADRYVQTWALGWWPCQPDHLSLIFGLLCMGWTTLYANSGERRWAVGSAVAFVTAVLFKEMGYVAGLGACLLLLRRPARWRLLAVLAGLGLALFTYRAIIYKHIAPGAAQDYSRVFRVLASFIGSNLDAYAAAAPVLVLLALSAVLYFVLRGFLGKTRAAAISAGFFAVPAFGIFGLPWNEPLYSILQQLVGTVGVGLLLVGLARSFRSWPAPEVVVVAMGCYLMAQTFPTALAWHRYWDTAFEGFVMAYALAGLLAWLTETPRLEGLRKRFAPPSLAAGGVPC